LEARIQQAGDDPLAWLKLVPLADEAKAKILRQETHQKLLAATQPLAPAARFQLAHQFAKLLPTTLHTPDEVAEVLGRAKTVSRQLLYRRYLEQWSYQTPLPLVLTFDHRKGLPGQLTAARAGNVTPP
jgi:hypothetical protein